MAGLIVAILGAASCTSVDRTVLLLPNIPGAEYVGSAECATCHEDIAGDFEGATHAKLAMDSGKGLDMGCESCHGPGSLHVEAGGGSGVVKHIINLSNNPEACFQCHQNMRGQFMLTSSHPVLSGQISCSNCHDPHKGGAIIAGDVELHSANETCFQCHTSQSGPFVFEHEAMRDGCTVCHEVHGSVNTKLLKARNANLCLQCHMAEKVNVNGAGAAVVQIGGRDHAAFLTRGTCWSAGCHEAPHGSNMSNSLRF